jgi:hypothetical protein
MLKNKLRCLFYFNSVNLSFADTYSLSEQGIYNSATENKNTDSGGICPFVRPSQPMQFLNTLMELNESYRKSLVQFVICRHILSE